MNEQTILERCCVFKCMQQAEVEWKDGRWYCRQHVLQASEGRDHPIYDEPQRRYEPEQV
jgi:hypothetical protein